MLIAGTPLRAQLSAKMPPKVVPMTQRSPSSRRPHTACSRLDPQPKLGPVSRIARLVPGRAVEHEVRARPARRLEAQVEQEAFGQPAPVDALAGTAWA